MNIQLIYFWKADFSILCLTKTEIDRRALLKACTNGSSFFTSLNDGLTSALISFLRGLLFQVAAVMILPIIFGIDGIWFSVVVAELVAAVMTILFIVTKKEKYHY